MPLTIGDPAPWFMAPTEENPQFNFSTLAGRWVGLVFAPDGPTAEGLARVINLQKDLDEAHACLFGVVGAHVGHAQLGPRWFFDPTGGLAKIYGVTGSGWLILDPQLRVWDRGQLEDAGALVRRLAEMPPPATHASVDLIAPVLILPRVFEPDYCRELIALYRRDGGTESGFMREVDGKTKLLTDPRHKQRKDVILEDEGLQVQVRDRINRRLVPEIRKVFQFQATRIERYLVACYTAGAGWFRPHRDNTTKGTAHRKFAVTINLNAEDYEGGELRFPEFGGRLYKPPTGGAVVFSCSLMHEARPVTKGERFAFLPFLYDEAGAKLREQNLKYVELPDAKNRVTAVGEITIRKVAGALGAEIGGVDLSTELSDAAIAAIRAALNQHQVIFFRDQTLNPDQQLRFGRRFGPLNIHPYVAGMAGHPEVMEVIKEPQDKLNFGGGWHSDMSFLETPSIGSILYAVETPAFGGDTLFASQAAAWDALSEGLKATLEGLRAVHSAGREYSATGPSAQKRASMQVAEAEGLAGEFIHPVVKVHPETGRKALYVNPAFTMRFDGWTRRESKPLLTYLFDHSRQEAFTCRFSWRDGSVAFWDNRQVWHYALNDYPGQRRHMRRVTVDPA